MSTYPAATNDNRQSPTQLTFLALLIATLLALSIFSMAQDDFVPNLPPSLRQQDSQNVPRPPHRDDQVIRFRSTRAVPLHVPLRLSQCEAGQCGTWEFNGSTGAGQWPHGGAVATFTVEKFDYDGIIIHRRDVRGNTPGLTAIYTGKIIDDQIKGDVTWTWAGFGGRSPHSVWAATVVVPKNFSVIDSNLPCKQFDMSVDAVMAQGDDAIYDKQYATALCWFRIAADRGNAEAAGLVSAFLSSGRVMAKDLPTAIIYAQKGAAVGNDTAEAVLSHMYQDGTLPKDPAKAEYWRAKSKADSVTTNQRLKEREDEIVAFQKEAMRIQNVNETAMNKALQQRQQQQNFAGELMLGIILGAMIADVGGDSGGSSSDGSFEQNRRDAINRQCMGGDSYACHQQDPLDSDYDH
jgi:hypothetical protein